MRTLVIGDIHSGKKALQQLLERAVVTPNDRLIFLGDYVDSWSDAFETVEFLMALQKTHNCVFIKGNHDALCQNWLTHQAENRKWLKHGGRATAGSYLKKPRDTWKPHIDFFESLPYYFKDGHNRLFVHAGFTNLKGVEEEYFKQYVYWDRTLWELAQAIEIRNGASTFALPKRLSRYHEIFIGHTPLSKTKPAVPKRAANVWNIDTGAAFKGPITALDVDTKEYWQSDPVHLFYPGEIGRNNAI